MCVRRVLACVALLAWGTRANADPPSGGEVGDAADDVTLPVLVQQASLRYPDGLQEGLHGDVNVRVWIDVHGHVTRAEADSGPEVFHDEAINAAMRLVFEPATRNGVAVPSTVLVLFHFAPPEEADDDIEEILVQTDDPDRTATHARETLDEDALEAAAGLDLATTVSQVAGVDFAGGTADTAKPIIRGQSERRLLLLEDGVRHQSQKWGPDHAPEIDPFSAGEIAVIKGAAGARYGPDAIGGVVLVDPPQMRSDRGFGGKALLQWSSNGLRPYGGLRLDYAPTTELSFRVEGTYARGAARTTPTYVLGNTASEQYTAGFAAQYRKKATTLRLTYHRYALRAGVFFGVRNATPAEFDAQLVADRPVGADAWTQDFGIDRPFQFVTHDRAALHLRTTVDAWSLEAVYAYQHNHRREFEQVRDADVRGAQYDFTLRSNSLDLVAMHPVWSLGQATGEGGLGLQGLFQENVYRGLSLVPNYRAGSVGVFGWERLSVGRWAVELGARYDHVGRTSYLNDGDFQRHERNDNLDETLCDFDGEVAQCPSSFDAGSVTLGALAHVVRDRLDLKLDLSSAARVPNVDELYLVGSAPSLPVFAQGDADLGVETTWGGSLTLGLRLPWLEGEASTYLNYVDDFINFAPLIVDGDPRDRVTARGSFPLFPFTAVDALFYGVDGTARLGPTYWVGLDVRGSMVRATEVGTGAFLVGTPPDRLDVSLIGRPPGAGPMRDPRIAVDVGYVARQSRTDPLQELAPAPDAYVLLGLEASADFDVGATVLTAGVGVRNLLNTRYRSYNSLMRYYADALGRDVRIRIGVDF